MRGNIRTKKYILYFGAALAIWGAGKTLWVYAAVPEITNVRVSTSTDSSAVIEWETDVPTEVILNYGERNDYGIVRGPNEREKTHRVELQDLDPSTTYYFRITAFDQEGNQGVSGNFSFTTGGFEEILGIGDVLSATQRALVGQVASLLGQINDEKALKIVSDQIKESARGVLRPPAIVGSAQVAEVGMDYAVIEWRTNRPAGSQVSFAAEDEYLRAKRYSQFQGIPDERTTEHRVRLVGLQPATTYYFKVSSTDDFGLVGESRDSTFKTKSRLPQILDVQLLKIEDTSVTLAWSTDIPAAGIVEYEDLATGEIRFEGSPELLTSHTVRLSDLTLGNTYTATIRVENEQGEVVLSDPIYFTTAEDKKPPIISKVTNESTLFPGAEARIQTIIQWETDEPTYCTLWYREGIQGDTDPVAVRGKEEPATRYVQVVVAFQPATVYQFWIECTDLSGNTARSEDFVLFTLAREKNIIDIILENFEGAFGWIKNIRI